MLVLSDTVYNSIGTGVTDETGCFSLKDSYIRMPVRTKRSFFDSGREWEKSYMQRSYRYNFDTNE